jgi:DNA-binding transcriptional regulator YdaS (Cro superfamily)
VLVLGGAAVGIAAAQAQPATTPTGQQTAYQRFIDALAKRLNITRDQLNQAISGARTDVGLSANGGFPGRGPRGFAFGWGLELNTLAQALGITPDQLRQELPGKSLTQLAQAHSKNPTDVANAMKNALHQRIDQAVANGRLTADQGNQAKQRGDQRIDQEMTRVFPERGQGRGPGRDGRGPGGDQSSATSS